MATTISVTEETRTRLMQAKLAEGAKSMDELLSELLVDHRKMRLVEASGLFRERLKEKGVRFRDLVQ
jgi:predicted CopG family antitoxin